MADGAADRNAGGAALIETVPGPVREVWTHLRQAGEVFLVGGAVRDLLLWGTEAAPQDYDLATNLPPERVQEHFLQVGYRVIPTGIRFGTVTVISRAGDPVEITTYRTEGRYDDRRRPREVAWSTRIEEDLARRDFTVNAAALSRSGDILLPPGSSLDDFRPETPLRAVGDADERLREDPLRILRAYRFAGRLGRTLDPSLEAACRRHAHRIRLLPAERLFKELDGILRAPSVGDLLTGMEEAGVLQAALPEWEACVGFVQHNAHHRLTVSRHIIAVVNAAPASIRWAALLHDIAKPACFSMGPDDAGHFFWHEERGAEMAQRILLRLGAPAALRDQVVTLIRYHLFPWDEAGGAAIRRLVGKVGPDAARDLILLRDADVAGKGDGAVWEGRQRALERLQAMRRAREPVRIRDLAVHGNDILALLQEHGVGPGPEVGRILRYLEERVLEEPEENTRERLLKLAADSLRYPRFAE